MKVRRLQNFLVLLANLALAISLYRIPAKYITGHTEETNLGPNTSEEQMTKGRMVGNQEGPASRPLNVDRVSSTRLGQASRP